MTELSLPSSLTHPHQTRALAAQAAMDATAELNDEYHDADLVTRAVDEEQVSRCAVLSTQPG